MTTKTSQKDIEFPKPIPGAPLIARVIMRLLSRYEVVGQLPDSQFLITTNHLSYMDVPAIAAFLTRANWAAAFAAKKYKRTFTELLFRIGSPVWIEQDSPDRRALMNALKLIKQGYNFAIAPEGHRSKTATLQQGREGAAFLASRANIPIVPIGIAGTEKMLKQFRPRVQVMIGKPYRLPEGRAKGPELALYTNKIMCAIAALLPESYRGVYADHPMLEEVSTLVRPDTL